VRESSMSQQEVFVVVRWDGFASDVVPPSRMGQLVTVKAVHVDEGSAQREVERLNALAGRADCFYFYKPALFIEAPEAIVDT